MAGALYGVQVFGPAYATPAHTTVTVGATSTAVLAANPLRRYALLVNDSDEPMYLALGEAGALNAGIRLNPNGGSYEMTGLLGNLCAGAVKAICASGGKKLLVTEAV